MAGFSPLSVRKYSVGTTDRSGGSPTVPGAAGARRFKAVTRSESTVSARPGATRALLLATMAFALPAAIGASLVDPDRPVIAFTGDGGLMMCAGELATAAELGCRLTVVVFNACPA